MWNFIHHFIVFSFMWAFLYSAHPWLPVIAVVVVLLVAFAPLIKAFFSDRSRY